MTSIASTGASTTSRIACSSSIASVLKSCATALLSIAALLLSATSAQAQSGSRSWTGATDSDFYNGANWDAAGDFPNGNITYAGTSVNPTINRNSGNTYDYSFNTFFNNTLGTQSSFTFPAPGTQYRIAASLVTQNVTSGSLTNEFGVNVVLVGGAKTITTGSNHHVHISGNLTGGSAWTKEGGGTLILSGANNTYTSPTTVNAGKLQLGNGGADGSLATTSAITVAGGATFEINQNDTVTQGTDFSDAAIAGSGTFAVEGGATVVLTNTASFDDGVSVSVASDSFLNLNFNGTDVVAGIDLGAGPVTGEWGATGSGASNESARITGTGTLRVSQNITWDASDDRDWTGLSDTTSWSTATFFDGDSVSFGATGAGTVTIIGAVQPSGVTVDSASDYTFTGDAIGGTGSLAKSGAGSLTLASANTYDGVTTISNGILVVGNDNALGSVVGNTQISSTGKLYVTGQTIAENIEVPNRSGNNQIWADSGETTFTGGITIAGNGIDIRGSSGTLRFAGGISGGATNGELFNTTASIYETTPLDVASVGFCSALHQLNVGGNNFGYIKMAFGNPELKIGTGLDNAWNSDTELRLGWTIAGNSKARVDLNGTSQTVAKLTQANGGVTTKEDTGELDTLNQEITGGGTLTIDGTSASLYFGRFTDGATATNVVKAGSGTLTLNNQSTTQFSTNTGSMTINAGIVESKSGSDFSDTGSVKVTSTTAGALNLNYAGTDQIAALDLGAGNLPDGVYGAGDSALITGTGTLTVVSPPHVWDGSTDSDWTNPDSDSWSGYTYVDGDEVTFLTGGAGTVTVSGAVAPASILVDSVIGADYTFTGDGSITGPFTKQGAGNLTIDTTLNSSAAITLDGGTTTINGAVTATISGGGSLSTGSSALIIDGGSFNMLTDGAVTTGLFIGNDTTLRNGGTITSGARFGMATGKTLVIEGGSGAAVTATNAVAISNVSTYRYVFDATGVAYLQAGTYAALDGASIEVDLTNFTGWGSNATFPLVASGNIIALPAGVSSPVEAPAGFTITAPGKTYGVDYEINVSTTTNVCEVAILEVAPPGAATWTGATDSTWTDGDSTNWDITYNNGQAAIFADAGAGTVTLSGAIAPSAVTVGGASDYTFAGAALGGTDTTLTKNDAGTLTLSVANTYTGATTVSGGVLAISDGTSLGTDAAGTTVTSGAQLAIDGGITVAEPLTIAGSGQTNNGGLKTVGVADNTISGAIDVFDARIRADGSSPLTLTGGITGDTLILTGAVTVSNTPIDLSETLNIAGDDVPTSYNASGGTDVAFNLGNVTELKVAGNSAATTNLFFDAQVQLGVDNALHPTTNLSFLSYGADISTYTTKFDLGGYSQTVASLSSTKFPASLVPEGVNMSITSTSTGGTGTLTVDQATDTTYSGRFDGTMNLVKAGAGTLTLDNRSSAAHSISGTTTVSAGILDIDTDYTSAITVAATGSLEVDLGTTLTLQGALSVDAASEIVIDGTPTLASYTLISATSITGTPVLSAPIVNYVLEVSGNELQLNLDSQVWNGAGDTVWAAGDATNWDGTYNNGAPVSFTDAGAGTVTVSTALTPLSVLVDSTADYTFTGAGSITGPFTKQGAGNLTIDTTLNSSAAITFNGGTTTITGAVESSISGGGNMTQGDGAIIIDGGTFSTITDGVVQTNLYMDNDITLRNGGTITSNARFDMAPGTTLVIEGGSGAAVTAANAISLISPATYRYEFDATGVAYLKSTGAYAALNGASFEVDLTNFEGWGSAATFPLVNTPNVFTLPAGVSSPVEAPAGFTITAPGKTYGVDYEINVSTTTNVCEVAILEVATNDVASWAAGFTASDASFTGSPATDPLTDYDNDGLSNLLEYVLGGSPIANQDTAVPTVSQDATHMIFTYNRSDISTATGNDVTIKAEYAADLSGSWTEAVNGTASVVIEEDTSADPDVVTVKVPLAGTEQFIRLNVVTGP